MMNKNQFWALIDPFVVSLPGREESVGSKRAKMLIKGLQALHTVDLVTFELIWRAYCSKLDKNRVYNVANKIAGGLSDDGFADFHGWAMINGSDVVDSILNDPHSLYPITGVEPGGKLFDCTCEAAGYVPMEALDRKFGSPHHHKEEYKVIKKDLYYDLDKDCLTTIEAKNEEKYGPHHEYVLQLANIGSNNYTDKQKLGKIAVILKKFEESIRAKVI